MRPPNEPFTFGQLAERGLAPRDLRRMKSRGEVRQVLRAVYVPSHLPDTIDVRTQAVALVLRPQHVVADRTAAWLHGVDHYRLHELAGPPPLDVVSLSGCGRPRRREVLGGERDLAPQDIMSIGELRVTTPARTAADLACRFGRRDALAVLDAFMRVTHLHTAELLELLPRYAGRRGVVQLRELVPVATSLAESHGESWCRCAILDAGLPTPVPQHWVAVDGVRRYRLDLAWPHLRIAVEYDGEEFHGPAQQEADDDRRRWLRAHGWTVIVVRKGDFRGPALDAWLDELRTAIRERTPTRTRTRYARAGR